MPATSSQMRIDASSLINRLKDISAKLNPAKITLALAQDAAVLIQERTLKGIDIDGAKFPQYSTLPFYMSKNIKGLKSIVKPIGKRGQKVFKNGKPHQSQYFAQGYMEFRKFAGRATDTDRLSFSGKMLKAMLPKQQGKNAVVSFNNKTEAEKARGNNEKYNFFGISQQDKDVLMKNLNQYLDTEVFNG